MFLHPNTTNKLAWYAKDASPNEAVGLLDACGKIFLLKNLSSHPHNSFEVAKTEMAAILGREDFNRDGPLTLWHSHPSGGVGPSRVDMQQKTPFQYHLVVSLTEDGPLFTWY